jgi:26S proteasome regulatory subunit N11
MVSEGAAKSTNNMNEVSGLLLGRESVDGLLITSAVTGKQISSEIRSELDKDFMAAIAYGLLAGNMRERIVGMFHSHPGLGVFLSQQDVDTLANFSRLYPGFLMMVTDPLAKLRYKFFRYDLINKSTHLVQVKTTM